MNFRAINFEATKYSREIASLVRPVKFINGNATDTFYSLIRLPMLYIRPEFTGLHGLTVEDVRDSPIFHFIIIL
jgi:DNA polymerase III epsilon subunit-like protein